MAAIFAQEWSQIELLPPSARAMIQARLANLTQPARQLVKASAVLGTQATAERLWQVAEVEMQAGIEALEEAVSSGILREEYTGAGRPSRYHFAHDLIRTVVYTQLGEARRHVLYKRVQALLETERAPDEELVLYASTSFGQLLERHGYTHVLHYAGGLEDWEQAGYPLEGQWVTS
jgi:predicted ATPase